MNFLIRRFVVSLVTLFFVAGCGHKGNLFLDSKVPEKQTLGQPVPQNQTSSQKTGQGS
ncbi:MAG: hypothetical protein HQL75_16455 [Magnetococcales bacterium]|nr:hypothetical protein [Magnetococcales bacterium]